VTIKIDTNHAQEEASEALPLPVVRARHKLGKDIRDARWRRRIRTEIAAQRASISRTPLAKIERGASGVSVASYATVLFVMGMTDRLADLAGATNDAEGRQLEEERLPQRIRRSRKK
jgi:hypothetical protein